MVTISAVWTGSGGRGWPSQRGPLFCVTCLSPGGAAVSGEGRGQCRHCRSPGGRGPRSLPVHAACGVAVTFLIGVLADSIAPFPKAEVPSAPGRGRVPHKDSDSRVGVG